MKNNQIPQTNPETESIDVIKEIDSVKQFIKETGLEKFTHLKGEEKTALTIRFLFGENSAEREFSDRNIRLAASFASGEKRIKYMRQL